MATTAAVGTANAQRGFTTLKALTGIRFFAALAVIAYHSGSTFVRHQSHAPQAVKNLLSNGYLGVTLFFVLSGFILQVVYGGKPYRLADFALARFARIYPVYIVAILLVAPFLPVATDSWPQFLLLQAWFLNTPSNNWNAPAWTLSVELFFYLLFPFLSAAVARLTDRQIFCAVVIAITFIATTCSPFYTSFDPAPAPVPLLRLPEFILGILAGALYARAPERRLPVAPEAILVALVAGLCASHDRWVSAYAAIVGALLLVALAFNPDAPLSRLLATRVMVLLGSASYSLYLIQVPLRAWLNEALGNSRMTALIQYPTLIGLSIIVFALYEEPARRWIRGLYRGRSAS